MLNQGKNKTEKKPRLLTKVEEKNSNLSSVLSEYIKYLAGLTTTHLLQWRYTNFPKTNLEQPR